MLTAAYLAPIATTYPGVTRSLGYPDGKRSSKRGSRSHTEEYADGKGDNLVASTAPSDGTFSRASATKASPAPRP